MAVPSKSTINTLTLHGAITRNRVFHKSGQQMTVVGQSIGKWWSVVENKFVGAIGSSSTLIDRFFKSVIGLPTFKDNRFNRWE